jgi:hypothetical protein
MRSLEDKEWDLYNAKMDLREIRYADLGKTKVVGSCMLVLTVWFYYVQLVLDVGACLENIT